MPPARRRVSYIIPSPSIPVPRLKLPPHGSSRLGAPGPLLIPYGSDIVGDTLPEWAEHPRHRLGVSCLALDTVTQLLGRDTPEGILYTGGRDGLVLSWDLGISLKRRSGRYGVCDDSEIRHSFGRWEIMTGWADEISEEDTEDEEHRSDGDILGDVLDNTGRARRRRNVFDPADIPYEEQWETDMDAFQPGKVYSYKLRGNCSNPIADVTISSRCSSTHRLGE
jgi:WD repeat-containing protein 48